SFVPPPQIRVLRHYTRARTHLTQDRTRCYQRLEKLLEDALIKVSAVASKLTTAPPPDLIPPPVAREPAPPGRARLGPGPHESQARRPRRRADRGVRRSSQRTRPAAAGPDHLHR